MAWLQEKGGSRFAAKNHLALGGGMQPRGEGKPFIEEGASVKGDYGCDGMGAVPARRIARRPPEIWINVHKKGSNKIQVLHARKVRGGGVLPKKAV